jgi:hypothetical protein
MRDGGGRGVLDSYVFSLVVVVGLVANLNERCRAPHQCWSCTGCGRRGVAGQKLKARLRG